MCVQAASVGVAEVQAQTAAMLEEARAKCEQLEARAVDAETQASRSAAEALGLQEEVSLGWLLRDDHAQRLGPW